jgi:hypothetical protein
MSKKALKISQKKNVIRFFLLICFGLMTAMTVMVFSSKASANVDLSYQQKAREKKYIGGADESELKVLAIMPTANSKKVKAEEASEGF